MTLAFFALSGITFTLPFYLQILRGYSVLQAGLLFLPFAVGQLIAAPRSAAMVLRFGYRTVITGGLIIVAVSLLGIRLLQIDTPLWVLIVVFFLFGFGMGNVVAPGSTVLQNVLPLARAGAGSAVQNTVRQVGGALGVAILGTVLATRYADNLRPVLDTLPPQVPEAAKTAASDSIVATAAILARAEEQGMPASMVEQLKAGAYDAFLGASHLTTLISLAVVVIAAVVVGFLLPYIEPPTARMERGEAPPPADAADALVQREAIAYREELAEEVVPDPHDKR